MPTKLSRYAEGIMEAGWLAAVIVVPVFFDIFSSRIFEPDKITLLRSLALVIAAAWLVKVIEEGSIKSGDHQDLKSRLKAFLEIPLVAPAVALAVIYIIATIFSVSPRTSLWGSYQRLQGTYTTFSYILIFACMAVNLRRRVQVERLIGAAIIAALPVSLYGILQHYRADPIPWGGDTTERIAANMGNSIFVAAYLIMVVPLTVMRIVESFEALLAEHGNTAANFARATVYIFILALQAVALYFSGSRGPWLGWGAGLVLIWLGLSLIWRQRWLTISGVSVVLVAGIFLGLLNIPGGPLESLRTRPEFGRLGQLLDAESRTGRVRTLIWQGAAELVAPHQPLEYPDGKTDIFNFLRPLIGYGPESMYVAYNPFYQPELTLVEKRNASPDRSHNETWDSLVITGILGLLAHLALFGSIFYYGLNWLELIHTTRQRNLFLALFTLGGVASALIFVLWRGVAFLGVALPFGMIVGLILYLILTSLFGHVVIENDYQVRMRAYVLLGLTAAILAHFVEISFGIAIVSTRTYFWVYTALLMLVGYLLPRIGEYRATTIKGVNVPQASTPIPDTSQTGSPHRTGPSAKKRSAARQTPVSRARTWSPWLQEGVIVGIILAVLLVTLEFTYLSNQSRATSVGSLIWSSLTTLPKEGGRTSYGLLALILTTWVVGAILLSAEKAQFLSKAESAASRTSIRETSWWKTFGVGLGISFLLALVFLLLHAGNLVGFNRATASTIESIIAQVRKSEGLLTFFYFYVFGLVFGMAFVLPVRTPVMPLRRGWTSVAIAAITWVVAFGLISYTNIRVIQADIAFKTAELFAQPNSWPVAIRIYQRAISLAPNEDYYYLFLGRAYLEYAKTLQDETERDRLIQEASQELRDAQRINPLNTDHTANLARLHSLWAAYTTDPGLRAQRAELAEEYFSKAVTLSRRSARLWDEWAVHATNILNQPELARERLAKAMEIDPYYDWTYALLADSYAREVANTPDLPPEEKTQALIRASDYYSRAFSLMDPANTPTNTQLRYGYMVGLGSVQAQLGNLEEAIQHYEQALTINPNSADSWRVELVLAQLYTQLGDFQKAWEHAQSALASAPEEQKASVQAILDQMVSQP